eukprot:CAMPEP_0201261444 /NCGR_PEP_ID=MMETSP0853-20130426/5585_1 /ASSEMBLY_ACC=CAM_ASM_000640 /TAXON_ID=183588 /ORGANISM="Pseudo-nitzschia fraudulenta, Strain WWA7" /LENGTH=167 /DNA_ID=CAMNT_0047564383 /DNA_START=977 /DNA_END=1477 /DNA_ORIENTATION=+
MVVFLGPLPQALVPDVEAPQHLVAVGGHDWEGLAVEHFLEGEAPQHAAQVDGKVLEVEHVLQKLKRVDLGGICHRLLGFLDKDLFEGLLTGLGALEGGRDFSLLGADAQDGPPGVGRLHPDLLEHVHVGIAVFGGVGVLHPLSVLAVPGAVGPASTTAAAATAAART